MRKLLSIFTCLIFCLLVVVANAGDLTSGLVGHWPLDGNAKAEVSGKDGKLVGGAEWVNDGKIKGAVKLNGTTGFVEVSGFSLTTTTITCVAWIKGWRQDAWTGIVASRGGTKSFWMGFTDQDTLSYVWNDDSDQTWGWRKGPKIPQDQWAMTSVAIEATKATAYIYSADKLVQEENKIAHIEQKIDGRLTFGWDSCCGDNVRHFLGLVDDVIIYDRTLSKDEILQLAKGGLTGVEPDAFVTTTWAEIKK